MSFRIHTSVIYHNKLIFPFTYNVCALLYVTYNICAIISPVVGIHTQPLLGMIGIKKKDLKNGDKNDMDRNYSVILVRHYIDAKEATRSVTFWKRHHVVYSMTFVVHE